MQSQGRLIPESRKTTGTMSIPSTKGKGWARSTVRAMRRRGASSRGAGEHERPEASGAGEIEPHLARPLDPPPPRLARIDQGLLDPPADDRDPVVALLPRRSAAGAGGFREPASPGGLPALTRGIAPPRRLATRARAGVGASRPSPGPILAPPRGAAAPQPVAPRPSGKAASRASSRDRAVSPGGNRGLPPAPPALSSRSTWITPGADTSIRGGPPRRSARKTSAWMRRRGREERFIRSGFLFSSRPRTSREFHRAVVRPRPGTPSPARCPCRTRC
jgi:hypothetical protein